MKKDILASGGHRAQFVVSSARPDAPVEVKNIMSAKDRRAAEADDRALAAKLAAEAPETAPAKKFVPTKGVLLVRRHEPMTVSRLVVDTTEKERPSEGTVLEAFPGSDVTVGSHIVFGKYAGTEFKLNGETLLLMDETDVKGFLVNVTVL